MSTITQEHLASPEAVPEYPRAVEITMAHRPLLHPLFARLPEGISEFTFANIYLFRQGHNYRLSRLADGCLVLLGRDGEQPFFMSPFGLPDQAALDRLLAEHSRMKCVSITQKPQLEAMGYRLLVDRDNFDYLYSRRELAELNGRKFMKKRNLIKAFVNNYQYEGRPLLEDYLGDAFAILEQWKDEHDSLGDYHATREALEKGEALQLCGGIYYADGEPAAFTLGEELACGKSFVIHFEKALQRFKGLYQFVNQSFASIIGEPYETLNREQDLGEEGLRHAKLSYRPVGFVEKFLAMPPTA